MNSVPRTRFVDVAVQKCSRSGRRLQNNWMSYQCKFMCWYIIVPPTVVVNAMNPSKPPQNQRLGIELPRNTLAGHMLKVGALDTPLFEALQNHILNYDIVQMDETPVVLRHAKRCECQCQCQLILIDRDRES